MLIEGVTVQFGPFWMLHPVYSENVVVRNVNVISFPDGGTITFTDADGVSPHGHARRTATAATRTRPATS